jgi:Leucine-rich repeat (LRR) protein
MKIYILRKGETYGPYLRESVDGFLEEGLASGGDLAWTSGQEGWIPLGKLLGMTSEPTVEQDSEGEQSEEQADPELAETVAKIENLLDKEEQQLALDLVVGLNDPKVYEAFLNECEIGEAEDDGVVRNWFTLQRNPNFVLGLVAHCPEEARVPPFLKVDGFTAVESQYGGIQDLGPFSKLRGLETIGLWANDISDLSPLSSLSNLKRLDLGKNQLSDLTHLYKLKNLEELYLRFNQVRDLRPLAGLTKLSYLWLDENQISDPSPLHGLKQLKSLRLEGNPLSEEELSNLRAALPQCEIIDE